MPWFRIWCTMILLSQDPTFKKGIKWFWYSYIKHFLRLVSIFYCSNQIHKQIHDNIRSQLAYGLWKFTYMWTHSWLIQLSPKSHPLPTLVAPTMHDRFILHCAMTITWKFNTIPPVHPKKCSLFEGGVMQQEWLCYDSCCRTKIILPYKWIVASSQCKALLVDINCMNTILMTSKQDH